MTDEQLETIRLSAMHLEEGQALTLSREADDSLSGREPMFEIRFVSTDDHGERHSKQVALVRDQRWANRLFDSLSHVRDLSEEVAFLKKLLHDRLEESELVAEAVRRERERLAKKMEDAADIFENDQTRHRPSLELASRTLRAAAKGIREDLDP